MSSTSAILVERVVLGPQEHRVGALAHAVTATRAVEKLHGLLLLRNKRTHESLMVHLAIIHRFISPQKLTALFRRIERWQVVGMRAYSVDLRERVVAAVVAEGWTQVRAARVYRLSEASVSRLVEAYQAGESLAARPGGGRPRKLRLPEHVAALREHLEAEPDLELSDRCEHLANSEGVHMSVPTLWRALRALGWTRKKDFRRQ